VEKEREIELGDICRVMSINCLYSNFFKFSNEAGHPDIEEKRYVTLKNDNIIKNLKVRILFLGHTMSINLGDTIVAIVETINNPEYLKFMISTRGLGFLESKKSVAEKAELFINKYLSGKSIKEKIPDEYLVNRVMLIFDIIRENPMDIQYISPNLLTNEHYKKVLQKDGGLLGLLPEERRTLELCKVAVLEEPYAKKFVPEELKSLVDN